MSSLERKDGSVLKTPDIHYNDGPCLVPWTQGRREPSPENGPRTATSALWHVCIPNHLHSVKKSLIKLILRSVYWIANEVVDDLSSLPWRSHKVPFPIQPKLYFVTWCLYNICRSTASIIKFKGGGVLSQHFFLPEDPPLIILQIWVNEYNSHIAHISTSSFCIL